MDENAPAMHWTRQYFTCMLKHYRGRNNKTLVITLIEDLEITDFSLQNEQDLNELQLIAKYDDLK